MVPVAQFLLSTWHGSPLLLTTCSALRGRNHARLGKDGAAVAKGLLGGRWRNRFCSSGRTHRTRVFGDISMPRRLYLRGGRCPDSDRQARSPARSLRPSGPPLAPPFLRHAPSGRGWLNLGGDAVVRDRRIPPRSASRKRRASHGRPLSPVFPGEPKNVCWVGRGVICCPAQADGMWGHGARGVAAG
jgi:hypothetical protein